MISSRFSSDYAAEIHDSSTDYADYTDEKNKAKNAKSEG